MSEALVRNETISGSPLAAVALMATAMLLLSSLDALAKYLVADYPVLLVSWARYASHLAIFGLVTAATHGLRVLKTGRLGLHVLRGLLLVGVTASFIGATSMIPLAEATAIAFLAPVLVTVMSVFVLKERVGRHRWGAVGLGFLGVLVIVRPDEAAAHWASLLAVIMAMLYAAYQIATRALNRTEAPLTTLTYTAVVGTAVLSLALPFVWRWPAPADIPLLTVTGLLGGGGHFLLILALRRAPASALAPFTYLQLVFAGMIGSLVFDEVPDTWSIAGAVMIAAGGLWIWRGERPAP